MAILSRSGGVLFSMGVCSHCVALRSHVRHLTHTPHIHTYTTQACFGLIAGFVNAYINGEIVAVYIGDGYIGFLSAIVTLTAAVASIGRSESKIEV